MNRLFFGNWFFGNHGSQFPNLGKRPSPSKVKVRIRGFADSVILLRERDVTRDSGRGIHAAFMSDAFLLKVQCTVSSLDQLGV